VDIKFDFVDIIGLLLAAALGVWYMMTKHWIANNILGLAFSIQGISLLSLGSYKVGCILLGGLFFYDIFWVFGTDVMVTVAKSFDAPIKLVFPKNIFSPDKFQFSMLGLGDIVIPGIFIALLLRFDRHFAQQIQKKKGPYSKTLFITTFISYILGLATTIFVMHTFKAAQPALLYLVPFCISGSAIMALIKGQFMALLAYEEETPLDVLEDKPKKAVKKAKKVVEETVDAVVTQKHEAKETVKKTKKKNANK